MSVKINDLRRPWTVDDLLVTGIERLHYVSIKDFRFDIEGNLVVRRAAEIKEKPPVLSALSRWVAISNSRSGLSVIKRGVKWDLVSPIGEPDDGWVRVDRSY